ncbi:MAG: Photosystem I reaction center subunit III [Mojavia pulchra JT2-VF2]|jgi:photosystem I subunit 3|uniref:Photosystem I reaction center subunit III n=1 Tax=Mojavia pulchra JT2-VF2 TaxID=287848 RepID=A0A951UGY6_9NOST|nr:Photosystem I reaction center subunit III [Mojavia pulchra JT2-VF2]
MRRLFALILAICLAFNFAPPAKALGANLTRCADNPAFQQLAQNARNTTADPESGRKRFERYAQEYCGPEGYPHLIVDGRLDRAGDFMIPSILFLYIAGWIGWVGRSYLQTVRKSPNPEQKEFQIDLGIALPIIASGFAWPVAALKEFLSGELTAKDTEIPVSPR